MKGRALILVPRAAAVASRRRILEAEIPAKDSAGGPVDAHDQFGWVHADRSGELDHRRDAGDPLPVLEHADLGPVQGGTRGQLVLRETGTSADATQVLAESQSHLSRSRFALVVSHSAAKWRFSDKELTDKTQHLR
jgi:hypothetical protein